VLLMQMNIMGNVKEPFLRQDRFEVTFTMSPPHYGFHLFIAGMRYSALQFNWIMDFNFITFYADC